jgi:hypothetical protein
VRVVIFIEADSAGGTLVTAEQLQADVDAGQGTTAHTYGLIAYRAMHARAVEEAAAGGYMSVGEVTGTKH